MKPCSTLPTPWPFSKPPSPEGFRCDQVIGPERAAAIEGREHLIAEMISRRCILHTCDDELYAARLCAALWPGRRIAALVQTIEAERRAHRLQTARKPS